MSKTVVINPGSGDLHNGFPVVTVQLWVGDHSFPEQFIGSLPPAPSLLELYRNWQLTYQALCVRKHLRSDSPIDEDDDDLDIEPAGITHVSENSFSYLCQKLQDDMNCWLGSLEFQNISRQLRSRLASSATLSFGTRKGRDAFPDGEATLTRSHLDSVEEIRVILETKDDLLRRLPWHRSDFHRDYTLAEIALSSPEYKRSSLLKAPTILRNRVRILAILGNSKGIDLSTETRFLHSIRDAEVVFLVNPSRAEFNQQLWDPIGWDILFFAGHSQTESQTGRIYINENKTKNSLTIEELEEALKAAIEKGLGLAIFNSCDGLGLANALERLNIPAVIVMREPVANCVAEEFFKQFILGFAVEKLPLYLAVQQARRKLQGLEDDFPGASWLPVLFHNPSVEPPTWLKLGGISICPYRGLFAFQEQDAHLFFGREQFTSDLVAAVRRKPLVAVVGSSGSGKSSVVFAGLIPQLRQDTLVQWQITSFRPLNNPFEALAKAIAPFYPGDNLKSDPYRLTEPESLIKDGLALYKIIERFVQQNPGTRLVLIVDQFEELYTQCRPEDRQLFLNALLNAVKFAPAFTLVITLRADFYGYALSDRAFSDALQGAVLNLGPMSSEELCSCIEKPAAKMQVGLENKLTNKLIHALQGQPGRLPLLEFALTQLWSKQTQGWLTHQGYEEIGGVEQALANHAEQVYAQLNEADRARAQRIFMQLVSLGEGVEATRRLATREEVQSENWDLVTNLASSRLLVTNFNGSTNEQTVEIVHETLIKSWGRLEYWLQLDGQFRRWQEQLRATIRQWENSDKDEGVLLRGKPLADAEYWQAERFIELTEGERRFIFGSLALRDREIKKQKQRRQLTIYLLTGGLILSLSLAAVAVWQWRKARVNEIRAITTSSEALFASNNKLDALIRAMTAWEILKTVGEVDKDLNNRVQSVLKEAIYGVVEHNRLLGHSETVNAVAFSPDNQIIASASDDKTVKLWNQDGKIITTLTGHSDKVNAVAFSPDGQIIATASGDKTVKLWKRNGVQLTTLYGHSDRVCGVAFSPDGQTIATASGDKTVKLWDRDGALLHTLNGHRDRVKSVVFSPDGQTIATASKDNTVKLWRRGGTLSRTLEGHTDEVRSVAFSPDGKTLASVSLDQTLKLWSLNGKLLNTINNNDARVYGVAFSPDGKIIATASGDKTVKLWNKDGVLLRTLDGHSDIVFGVAFSSDSQTIASSSRDKTIRLWKLHGNLLTTLHGHNGRVRGVTFSPDGQTIATASDDKTAKLWRRDGTEVTTLKGHKGEVWSVAFSPDGQAIATASRDKTIKLWSRSGKLLTTLYGHTDSVNAVAFSPNGKMIASASDDKTIKLWTSSGKLLTTLKGHKDEVWGVVFSPDGNTIASSSRDKTVKIWKLDGKELMTLKSHNAEVRSVAFSPDNQMIATGGWDKTIKLWSRSGVLLRTLKGHEGAVNGVAFSPDSQRIVSSSLDQSVKIWTREGKLVTTLNGHSDIVSNVAFSPDGKAIASASEDKTVILWDLDDVVAFDKLLAYSCGWVSDYLRTNVDQDALHNAHLLCAGINNHSQINIFKLNK